MNSFKKEARNLAEATLRLVKENNELLILICNTVSTKTLKGLGYALDDAEGEAKNILAKTQGE